MRGGTVAGAVLMMVLGFVFVSLSPIQSYNGGAGGLFSPQIIGVLLMLLGFILFIAGLAASPKEEKQPIMIQAPAPYMPPQFMPQPMAQPITTVLLICPKCKKRILAESKFCPECGYVLQAVPSMPPDAPRFCEKCGALREDGDFCKRCGAKV
jgi:RNA polymerase subunit RPABC4/transcription elongation factor Spt4